MSIHEYGHQRPSNWIQLLEQLLDARDNESNSLLYLEFSECSSNIPPGFGVRVRKCRVCGGFEGHSQECPVGEAEEVVTHHCV